MTSAECMSDTITVPATLASCTREGLHTEFGTAVEQLSDLTERAGERSFEVYREHLEHQAKAQVVLEEIGGETPDPPVPIKVNVAHRPTLIHVLREQQQSYIERLVDMDADEQRAATELIQELNFFINANERAVN